MGELSDQEFVNTLRAGVLAYLEAVDRWEAAYRRYYRMPGYALTISSDMESEQNEFEAQLRSLELLLPRARRLCLKHHLRNPFPSLVRTSLGRHAPQHRIESSISRNERNAVTDCLVQLADTCSGWTPQSEQPDLDAQELPASTRRVGRFHHGSAMLAGVLCALTAIAIGVRPALTGRYHPPNPSPQERPNPRRQTATARFYRIEGRPLTRWGDYGDILQHGMTSHLGRVGGLLSLERTGPYMPPITFPGVGDIVLSSAGRKLLEASGLSGFSFQPVNKSRIVDLPWHDWDLTTDKPPDYPESGEPEDYILDRRPNARVAEEMGDIWELVVPVTAKIRRPREIVESFHELYLELDSWNGADIFRGNGYGSPLVSKRGRAWLEEYFGGYTQFEEFARR